MRLSSPMIDRARDAGGAPACVLYHGPDIEPDMSVAPSRTADDLLAAGPAPASAAVLLVDTSLLERIGDPGAIPWHVIIVAADKQY